MKLNFEYNICNDAAKSTESFVSFESINKKLYLIYIKEDNSIISYDLIHKQIITTIDYSHLSKITHIKHYLDDINQRDLLMTCSSDEIKIWNIKNYQIISELKRNFDSACLIKYNKKYYFALASEKNPILIYDFEGNLFKEIKNEYEISNIFSFNDEENSYLITLNELSMCSYKNLSLYKKYKEEYKSYSCCYCNGYSSEEEMIKYSNGTPLKCIYNKKDNNMQLIEANEDDHSNYFIKVWDLNLTSEKKELDSKICLNGYDDMCLINNNKLLVQGGEEINIIYLDELKKEQIEKLEEMDISEEDDDNDNNSPAEEDKNCSFVRIVHPFSGECLIWKNGKKINLISIK